MTSDISRIETHPEERPFCQGTQELLSGQSRAAIFYRMDLAMDCPCGKIGNFWQEDACLTFAKLETTILLEIMHRDSTVCCCYIEIPDLPAAGSDLEFISLAILYHEFTTGCGDCLSEAASHLGGSSKGVYYSLDRNTLASIFAMLWKTAVTHFIDLLRWDKFQSLSFHELYVYLTFGKFFALISRLETGFANI